MNLQHERIGVLCGRPKLATLPAVKTHEQYDFGFASGAPRAQIHELAGLAFVARAQNVVFVGSGLGKSHLAAAIAYRATQAGIKTRFLTATDLMMQMAAARNQGRLKEYFNRAVLGPKLLVVDEIGYLPCGREEANLFFRLVTYRYGRGAFLITTNKSMRGCTELLAADKVLATAVLDRLLHRTNVLNIKGPSYRLRDPERALGTQKV